MSPYKKSVHRLIDPSKWLGIYRYQMGGQHVLDGREAGRWGGVKGGWYCITACNMSRMEHSSVREKRG